MRNITHFGKKPTALTLADMQALIAGDNVAIAIFVLGVKSSSVYVLSAEQAEPQRLDLAISSKELQEMLPGKHGERTWKNNSLQKSLPQLSEKLLHPLRKVVNKGGVTKAEALRRAQLTMYEQKVDAIHWAPHILIGDYR